MHFLILQHVPFEGPAAIKQWAEQRNHSTEILFTYENTQFPAPDQFDGVFIMGGPMGVNDPLPWIEPELEFIRTIADKKFVVGICLGAQLIAKALGATVQKNSAKEIGWFDITQVTEHAILNSLPKQLTPLHWHGDTFDLPEQAQLLYSSTACANQAFIIDRNILGLQFHLEFNRETAQRLAIECEEELLENSDSVQSAEAILTNQQGFAKAQKHLFTLLDNFIAFNE